MWKKDLQEHIPSESGGWDWRQKLSQSVLSKVKKNCRQTNLSIKFNSSILDHLTFQNIIAISSEGGVILWEHTYVVAVVYED